jgi:hypothetical protein
MMRGACCTLLALGALGGCATLPTGTDGLNLE